jgi:CHAT domain-containing protein
MKRFHHNLWVKKLPKAEALREAQLFVLKEGSSQPELKADFPKGGRLPPKFWAAWVLSGDWR